MKTNKKKYIKLFFSILFFYSLSAHANSRTKEDCTSEFNIRANSLLLKYSNNWKLLYIHHEKFYFCDDGELGEGYSESVTNLLANYPSQYDMFFNLAKRNKKFEDWVIKHVDSSASEKNLKKIMINSKKCSNNSMAKSICNEISQSANEALKEIDKYSNP